MSTPATIHRMVTPKHLCPWGVKALDLLKRHGFAVTDHHLKSKAENERYKREHGVTETPQISIDGQLIGGYDALREHLHLRPDPDESETYQPVIVVFSIALLMAVVECWSVHQAVLPLRVTELFIAFSMCILGTLKLQNLQSFATGFVQYDLLARRYVPYATVYAFVETMAGVLMIGGLLPWVAAPATLAVSTLGAVSVFKAVYVEKRDLNCACVGGGSSVPLGFVSLTENLLMMAMGVWMLVK